MEIDVFVLLCVLHMCMCWDAIFFQNQSLKVELREAAAQNLASDVDKFEMELKAASKDDATVRPMQDVAPVNHRSKIPILIRRGHSDQSSCSYHSPLQLRENSTATCLGIAGGQEARLLA
jgi:hypothetical protein